MKREEYGENTKK